MATLSSKQEGTKLSVPLQKVAENTSVYTFPLNKMGLTMTGHYWQSQYLQHQTSSCSYTFKLGITNSRYINSLTTEKQTTKFSTANFQKNFNPSYTILRIQRLEGKQCRSR